MQARTRFLNELTNGTAPYAPTLFFSLLNAIVVYDPVGWGVPFAGYARAHHALRAPIQPLPMCAHARHAPVHGIPLAGL